jgi:hypothetical protein
MGGAIGWCGLIVQNQKSLNPDEIPGKSKKGGRDTGHLSG